MPDKIFRDQHHHWKWQTLYHTHQATPENPTLQSSHDSQPYEKSSTPEPSAKAQFTQQPQLHGLTPKQTPGSTWPVLHLTSPAPFPKPQPPAPMRYDSVLLVIMIYILLVQHSSNTRPVVQLSNPTAIQHWSYSCL